MYHACATFEYTRSIFTGFTYSSYTIVVVYSSEYKFVETFESLEYVTHVFFSKELVCFNIFKYYSSISKYVLKNRMKSNIVILLNFFTIFNIKKRYQMNKYSV